MNPALRTELDRLKERQAHLLQAVDLLGIRIGALEQRIAEETHREAVKPVGSEAGASAAAALVPRANAPVAVPPVLNTVAAKPSEGRNIQPATFKPQPAIVSPATRPPVTFTPPVPPPVAAPTSSKSSESFELRLGTYWLVRIGIVAMLTALVFFGAYAYQNFIPRIGPAGKVALLYLASGALLGFGAWFQRRAAKESLRNYAQVLFAGGMAAVYFTTYAAHHFPNLRIIASATLDGALLLGWAGYMAWTADRKKSEVLAVFAVGLAYYSSVMTRVGHFTLYSNLILAAVVVVFLVRNRWARLSFASLVATYASYGFWRFFSHEGWHWAGVDDGLWTGVYFLAAYWVVFTVAAFLSRHKEFAGVNRASFVTLNNAAFYALFLLTMFQVQSGGFWKFNLILGAALLSVVGLAKRFLREEPLAANTYLAHGLLLVMIATIAKFSHDESVLALALVLESVVLWISGTLRRNIIMRTSACVSAALATGWAVDGIGLADANGIWVGTGVGLLLVFNAWWSQWKGQGKSPNRMRVAPTYFSALALLLWSVTIWQNVGSENRPVAYALLALLLVAQIYLTRLRELGLLVQALLPFGAFLFVFNIHVNHLAEPLWAFGLLAGASLALVHWWQRQSVIPLGRSESFAGQIMASLIFAAVTGLWLQPKLDTQAMILSVSALAVGMTIYGALTRNGALPLVGQSFTFLATAGFLRYAGSDSLGWLAALAPLAVFASLAIGGRRWVAAQTEIHPLMEQVGLVALWYGRLAMALMVWWTFQYAGAQELVWSFTGLGVLALGIFGWRKNQDFLVLAAVLNLCALCSLGYHLMLGNAVYWPNFLSVLVWMTEQQLARKMSDRFGIPEPVHGVVMTSSGIALWWLTTQWVRQGFSGFYLTASWSLFAFLLLAVGVARRERLYRWLGLGIVGAAVGRVVIFDVWRLETLYRILSFFALGLVLLVLGFIYNKYQERIRQWL